MDEFFLGTLIKDRYRIESQLGSGGFGAVYLARDQQLRDRPVVVKILLDSGKADQWFQRKFSQEIEALSRINHPGVVTVIDAGELPTGQPFMVQQFVEGATLRQAIQPGGMDLIRVAHIIRRAGQALTAAHERGIFHRDLKPDNVMLQRVAEGEEHVTLIDFGIASVANTETDPLEKTKVTGTFTYMAPEQFDGKPTAASDTYALGVIAYEMLAGAPPSTGKPLFEVMLMQKEGTWPKISELRPSVPLRAQEAILKALSYKPDERFSSAQEFGETLAKTIEDSGVAAPASRQLSSATGGLTMPGRRLVWILGAITALTLTIAIWAWNSRRTEPLSTPLPKLVVDGPIRQLAYWISVQPVKDDKPAGDPFVLSHERVFRTDDHIFITVSAPQPGYLYIINQEPVLRDGLPSYKMLFPSPTANAGSAALTKGQQIRLPQQDGAFFKFDEQLGVERLWVVWSEKEIPALSGIEAGNVPLPPAPRQRIGEFLQENEAVQPMIETSEASLRTMLSRQGSLLVHRIELTHR